MTSSRETRETRLPMLRAPRESPYRVVSTPPTAGRDSAEVTTEVEDVVVDPTATDKRTVV